MNKKSVGIIGVFIAVIIVILGVCAFVVTRKSPSTSEQNTTNNETSISEQNATGAFNNTSITINGYTIDINSKEAGHPSSESYFNTSFDIISDDNIKSTYDVDFVDLELDSDNIDNEGITYDIAKPEEVTINGKKFEYYIEEFNENATLYYQIPDGNGRLIIKVSGGSVFDSKGNEAKTLAFVDKEVLESSELAAILNFSVKK